MSAQLSMFRLLLNKSTHAVNRHFADCRNLLAPARGQVRQGFSTMASAGVAHADCQRRSDASIQLRGWPMSRERNAVAADAARQTRPQLAKLTTQANGCDALPDQSSAAPKATVPRKPPPKPTQE